MTDTVYLDPAAASQYLQTLGVPITVGGLGNMRHQKRGPKYAKIAGKIRYKAEWLNDYVAACEIAPKKTQAAAPPRSPRRPTILRAQRA